MGEILIAVGIFVFLVFVAAGGSLVVLMVGGAMATVGLTVGLVVGISYHLALYRALAPMGVLGSSWWWRPTSYNAHLPSANRPAVMSWFYAGVMSMVVAMVGCALILTGILMM